MYEKKRNSGFSGGGVANLVLKVLNSGTTRAFPAAKSLELACLSNCRNCSLVFLDCKQEESCWSLD